MAQFYLPSSGALYTDQTLLVNTGFPPTAAPSALAANGIYTVTPSPDPYDPLLYTSEPTFAIAGDYALESWVATPLPLPTAKVNATGEVKVQSNESADALVTSSGVNLDIWTGAASQLAVDRPPLYNTLLGEMATIGDNLATTLDAIDAATTVDEINNIVNPPTGILSTGRGAGDGPLDLNISSYTEFNSVSLTEAETELYIPATSTVLTYGEFAPDAFDSAGNCFTTGNYLVQIREVATGMVIAEFECPLALTNVDVPF
jgi:hypothetical protein